MGGFDPPRTAAWAVLTTPGETTVNLSMAKSLSYHDTDHRSRLTTAEMGEFPVSRVPGTSQQHPILKHSVHAGNQEHRLD